MKIKKGIDMKRVKLPSKEKLEKVFIYEPDTGKIFNRKTKRQLCTGRSWYGHLTIDGQGYAAHRVIWKMYHGKDPDTIDHINGKGYDNRIKNLRSVSQLDNSHNRRYGTAKYPNFMGAYKKRKGEWVCKKTINGVAKDYGSFPCRFCAHMEFVLVTAEYWKNRNSATITDAEKIEILLAWVTELQLAGATVADLYESHFGNCTAVEKWWSAYAGEQSVLKRHRQQTKESK